MPGRISRAPAVSRMTCLAVLAPPAGRLRLAVRHAFALWYLMFPRTAVGELAAPDREPQLVDYLDLSLADATAVSPNRRDAVARWAKLAMLVQSAPPPAVGALVIARAVNILSS